MMIYIDGKFLVGIVDLFKMNSYGSYMLKL